MLLSKNNLIWRNTFAWVGYSIVCECKLWRYFIPAALGLIQNKVASVHLDVCFVLQISVSSWGESCSWSVSYNKFVNVTRKVLIHKSGNFIVNNFLWNSKRIIFSSAWIVSTVFVHLPGKSWMKREKESTDTNNDVFHWVECSKVLYDQCEHYGMERVLCQSFFLVVLDDNFFVYVFLLGQSGQSAIKLSILFYKPGQKKNRFMLASVLLSPTCLDSLQCANKRTLEGKDSWTKIFRYSMSGSSEVSFIQNWFHTKRSLSKLLMWDVIAFDWRYSIFFVIFLVFGPQLTNLL